MTTCVNSVALAVSPAAGCGAALGIDQRLRACRFKMANTREASTGLLGREYDALIDVQLVVCDGSLLQLGLVCGV